MERDVETTIQVVTVYPDRALVERAGTVAIEAAGEHALRVRGLPRSLFRESLRATGRGPAGTRILGIEQESEIHEAPPEETLRALREEISRLQRALELIAERQKIQEEQRGWLRTLGEWSARSLARGIAGGTAKPDDAGTLFTYTSAEADRLAEARIEMERRREETQRELDARNRELRELGGAFPDRLAAVVRIQAAEAGEFEVRLSYLVPGASWEPRYDARVDKEGSRVRLTQQALVSQRTGEEWRGVALALSTAQPAAAMTLPKEPDPWYVDVVTPRPVPPPQPMAVRGPVMARSMVTAAPAMAYGAVAEEMAADMMQAKMVDAALAGADIERSGAAQIFRVPGGVDVPSDGMPHTLGLGDADLPCRFDYVAAPVLAPGAHLRAEATNTTGGVLLPGELHVFHAGTAGDEYIGATRLDLTAENADITLYLGVDDNMPVKRELAERDTDKAGLLKQGIRRVTIGYRVTLGNRTGAAQRITLKDRLPVPRSERIKLNVLEIKPSPATRTRLEQLAWELTLAPGEERRVEWRFTIEAPGDLELAGLP
ncbi:MAG: Aspartate ammonia-lyase [Ktedonobacterales bacterium]|jgi:uncharacterized protein (TIGR02231 family)|nr:MAG: Aspartate ammonia-lyase [Ktedonobacterales bacterium]